MHALLLALTLAAAPAPARNDAPPALWFAVDRALGTERAPALASTLRTALVADPENLWLHDAWQRLLSRPPLYDGRLDVEYRAFLAQAPASTARQLLLALALIRAHEYERDRKDWSEEAKRLVEGVRGAPGLEAWTAIVAGQLARVADDRAGRRKEIETAWEATRGHLALIPSKGALESRDEAALARFALEVATRDPRFVPRLFEGHTPPLEAGAVEPMKKVVEKLARATRESPGDAELAWSLYQAAALLEDGARAEQAARQLAALDPAWKAPEDAPTGAEILAGAGFSNKLNAAVSSPPERASEAFAAIESEAMKFPGQLQLFYLQWAAVHVRGPARDPKRATELYKKALAAPAARNYTDIARTGFARNAADAGIELEEAARAAEQAVDRAMDGVRADRGVSGGIDDRKSWAQRIATTAEARGAVKARQGDHAGARRDLALATFLNPDEGSAFARLAEVETALGHADDAFDAWVGAVARGAYEPERLAAWREKLDAAARERLVWATVDELVAAEKARLGAAKGGGAAEPPAHPLVGQPAPDFEVARMGGGSLTLAALKGKPVIVDFWATWCGPCKIEMPVLQRLHEKYGDKGVSFVMLSTDDDSAWSESVPGFIKGMGVTMAVGRATEAVQSAYRVGGIPSLFLVGRDGKVVRHHLGFEASVEQELTREIEAQLR